MDLITYSEDVPALIARAKKVADKYSYIYVDEDQLLELVMPKTRTNYNTIDGVTYTSSHIKLPSIDVLDDDGNLTGFIKEFEGVMEVLGIGINRHPTECPHLKARATEEGRRKYDNAYPLRDELDSDGNPTGNKLPWRNFGEFDTG